MNPREIANGLMYILSTGCQWRAILKDLPPERSLPDALQRNLQCVRTCLNRTDSSYHLLNKGNSRRRRSIATLRNRLRSESEPLHQNGIISPFHQRRPRRRPYPVASVRLRSHSHAGLEPHYSNLCEVFPRVRP